MVQTYSSIEERYVAENPNSARLHARADKVIAGAVTHDMRYLDPYLIYVQRPMARASGMWMATSTSTTSWVMAR